ASRPSPHRARVETPAVRRQILRDPLIPDEPLAFGDQPVQQLARLPHIALLPLPLEQPVPNRPQADLVRPAHRAASIDRPAVSVDPDDIDVAGADRELLLEDLGALVHHAVQEATVHLLLSPRPPLR